MTATSTNPYTQASANLRKAHRTEFELLKQMHKLTSRPGEPWPLAMRDLKVQYRAEYLADVARLKVELGEEVEVDVEAAIRSILTPMEELPQPVPKPTPVWKDPTHGTVDRDIQERVAEMQPSSLGQKVAMEQTLQNKRDREEELRDRTEEQMDEPSPTVPLANYSMALDEIYLLRAALADEAAILDVHLEFKTFPKSRRAIAEKQAARMRGMAAGQFEESRRENFDPVRALRGAAIDDCMTRDQWERQRGLAG